MGLRMNKIRGVRGVGRAAALGAALSALAACGGSDSGGSSGGGGGGGTTFTIGGSVSGLSSGAKVVLQDNGGDSLTVSANGAFTFTTALAGGAGYAVTVATEPSGESCTVSAGSGTVGTTNVTGVAVSCAPLPKYTIGGAVSGLSSGAQLVLEDNGGDNLTVSVNGAFTFTTALPGGAAYAVAISTQPAGETCALSNASGTVSTSNVTNIAAACTVSGGSGAGAGFWIPYSATLQPATTGGTTGLFLIASNAIAGATAPPMKFVASSVPTLLGVASQGYLGGATPPTTVTPALMMYAATGSDGNWHIYGLNLANPSNSPTPPTPVQVTNLSAPASKSLCSAGQLQSNLTSPSTLSVVVYVATPETGTEPGETGYCQGAPGGTYYLASYTDSATAAPTTLGIPGGTGTLSALENDGIFVALNAESGTLGGLLLWDAATQDENFYATDLFTSAAPLLTGVSGTPFGCVSVASVINGAHDYLAGNYLAAVKTSTGYNSYEFTASGTAHDFYAGQASDCLTDASNLYFIGTPSGGTTSAIYQESLSSLAAPKTLLSLPAQTVSSSASLIGSNGALLVLGNASISGGSESTTIETLPLGETSAAGASIGGPYAGSLVSDFLASPDSGAPSADVLFLSEINESTSGGSTTVSYASQVLNPAGAGTTLQSTPDSVWESFGPYTTELDGNVILVKGIVDIAGGYGGATLYQVNVGSLGSPVGLIPPGSAGAGYQVPAGYEVSFTGFYGTSIATGSLISLSHGPELGVAVDVSHHAIVPLALANTNVAPMF
jgi:hypothetical protein